MKESFKAAKNIGDGGALAPNFKILKQKYAKYWWGLSPQSPYPNGAPAYDSVSTSSDASYDASL